MVFGALVTGLGAVAFFGHLSQMEAAYGWGNLTRMGVHTSAGFLFAGHALMWMAWRISPKDETLMPAWSPMLPAAFGITASICLWQALSSGDARAIHRQTRSAAASISELISEGLRDRMMALRRMGGRWNADGGTPRSEWERDVREYITDNPSFQAIEWVDARYRVQWIVPLAGNEQALGLNLAVEESRRRALIAAREAQQATLSAPVDLVQGGRGLLAYVPLEVEGEFDGFILGVFRAERLFGSLLGRLGEDYAVSLAAGEDVFFLRDNEKRDQWRQWGQSVPLSGHGARWVMELTPTEVHLRDEQSVLPGIVLNCGVFGSLSVCGLIGMYKRGRRLGGGARLRADARFRQVIESSPIGMLMVNDAGNITFANRRAEEIFDYSEGDLDGRTVEDLVPEAQRQAHPKHRQEFDRHGSGRLMGGGRELKGLRRDGTEVPVEIGLAPIQTEEGRQIIASVMDVTLRRAAEARSKELTERLRLATESAEIGIWDWDISENRLEWDDTMYAIYGISSDEFSGAYQAWEAGLHRDDKDGASAAVNAAVKSGEPFKTVFRIVHPVGDIRHIQAYGLVQRDDYGRSVRMLGTNWDITDTKEAEALQRDINSELELRVAERTVELNRVNRELRLHADALENSNRDLESFAYVASHDLQEPLRKIRAFGDILREDLGEEANEDALDSLNTITSAVYRMSDLIEALLVFARAAHQGVGDDAVDLDSVMREVIEDLELSIAKVGAKIEIAPLGMVKGDTAQLRQLFQNLVGNSLKHRRPDAPMLVEISAQLVRGAKDGSPDLVVIVKDSGKGFDQEHAERIFKPFQRLEGRNSATPGQSTMPAPLALSVGGRKTFSFSEQFSNSLLPTGAFPGQRSIRKVGVGLASSAAVCVNAKEKRARMPRLIADIGREGFMMKRCCDDLYVSSTSSFSNCTLSGVVEFESVDLRISI